MPRNAAGTYTLPAGNPVVAGTAIEATWANTTLADIANELTNSLSREGEGGMLAPFRVFDGNAAAPGLAFLNEPSSGIYRAGSGEVWLSVLTEPVLQLTTSGVLVPTGKTFTAQGNVTVGGTLTASGGVTGNASTATALQTARLIFGQSFNGTGNVTGDLTANGITAQAGVYVSTDINLARTGANQINGFFTTGVDDANFRLGVSNGQAGGTGTTQGTFGLFYMGVGEVATIDFRRGSTSTDGSFAFRTSGNNRATLDNSGNFTATGNLTANGGTVTIGSSPLAPEGSSPSYACRAWVKFNGLPLSGTYSRSGTTVTCTVSGGHQMIAGQYASLTFSAGTGGTATSGTYQVTVVNSTTFTITDSASGTITGTPAVTVNNRFNKSGNVSSISDIAVGNYQVNFATAMPDAYYTTAIKADSLTGAGVIREMGSGTSAYWFLTQVSGSAADCLVDFALFR